MTETYIEKLARWYCTLNNWEWPDDLQGKPDGWNDFPEITQNKNSFIPNRFDWSHGVMEGIEKLIGRKETLRWHHIHNLNRTNDEFESWWENNK